jgi:hypothetical protein
MLKSVLESVEIADSNGKSEPWLGAFHHSLGSTDRCPIRCRRRRGAELGISI